MIEMKTGASSLVPWKRDVSLTENGINRNKPGVVIGVPKLKVPKSTESTAKTTPGHQLRLQTYMALNELRQHEHGWCDYNVIERSLRTSFEAKC